MIVAMSSAEVPKFTVVLRKAYAAGYYAMCAPGLRAARDARAAHARRSAPMAPEASVNAVYADKIAAIDDSDERAAFIAARVAEQQRRGQPAAHGQRARRRRRRRPGEGLRAELIARLRRRRRLDPHQRGRRHHLVSPV